MATGSRENVERVQAALQTDEAVADFEFATAEQQLADIRKEHPELVDALTENPLPHKFTARLGPSADAPEVMRRYRSINLPGVESLRYQGEDPYSQPVPLCD